ncbi:epithelial membrane protein 1-like [Clavelina lepadiformis]|uniref:Uncharacterized protein n=1 Tax=Clavelina lepadiformis TaxID=159417 RepID=A0ABP0GND1_CLALP
MNQNFLLSFEIFFITCSVTLSLVSFVTTDWIHKSHDKMSQGLWEVCVSHLCRSFSTIGIKEPPYIQAVRAFIIMSMVGQAMSTCSIIYAFSNKSYHRKLTTALLLWSGICTLVAMAAYIINMTSSESGFEFGFSFILGWLPAGLCFALAVFTAIAHRPQREDLLIGAYT